MQHADPRSDADFGAAAEVINASGTAPVVLVCEHASAHIPAGLGGLGLDAAAARSHAAWDLGALDVARQLSQRLDAPLLSGLISRLVYDCNRPPEAADAIPARSEVFEVPGNRELDAAARARRIDGVYEPFHAALGRLLTARRQVPCTLISVHSFTPVFHGVPREVELGLLHGADDRLARSMMAHSGQTGWLCALNAPYGPQDGVLHTLQRHAGPQRLLNVMIELRNDLITSPEGAAQAAARLDALIRAALDDLGAADGQGRA